MPVVALIPFWVHFQKLVALLCRSTGQNATRTRFGTQNGQISRTRRPLAAARINALLGAFRETRCTSVRIRGATATRTDPCTEKPGLASGLIDTFGRVAGAVGLAAIATITASAAHDHGPAVTLSAGLTSGYDRAFAVSAAILVVGAALALLLPRPTDVGTVRAQVADEVRGSLSAPIRAGQSD